MLLIEYYCYYYYYYCCCCYYLRSRLCVRIGMLIGRTTTKEQALISTVTVSFNARYGRNNTREESERVFGSVRREWVLSTS